MKMEREHKKLKFSYPTSSDYIRITILRLRVCLTVKFVYRRKNIDVKYESVYRLAITLKY